MEDTYLSDTLLLAWRFARPLLSIALIVAGVISFVTIVALTRPDEADPANKAPAGARPSIVFALCFFFAIVGAYIGMGTGNSRDPIVGTIIPAALSLIGTAMAYLFSRKGDASPIWKILGLPAMLAFVLSAMASQTVGSTARIISEANQRNDALCEKQFETFIVPTCKDVMAKAAETGKEPANAYVESILSVCTKRFSEPHPCGSSESPFAAEIAAERGQTIPPQ